DLQISSGGFDIFAAADCTHHQVAAGEPDADIGIGGHFDDGMEIVMGRVLYRDPGAGAGHGDVAGGFADVAAHGDADHFLLHWPDLIATALELHLDTAVGDEWLLDRFASLLAGDRRRYSGDKR